jgi:hypothetical protein
MAVDDVTTVININQTGSSSVDRQPSSGVTEMLLDCGANEREGSAPNIIPRVTISRVDGTNNDGVIYDGNAGAMATSWFRGAKLMIDNTNYLRMTNPSSTAQDITFGVIQVG